MFIMFVMITVPTVPLDGGLV